jgi:hypothetical protein
MGATPAPHLPRNSLPRRLRRRYPMWYLFALLPLAELIPLAAGLSRLLVKHDWTEAARWAWLAECVLMALVSLPLAFMVLLMRRSQPKIGPLVPKSMRGVLGRYGVSLTLTVGFLLTGRIEWAVVAWFGGTALSGIWFHFRAPNQNWRGLVRTATNGLIAVTMLSGSAVWFAAAGLLLLLAPWLATPSLRALLVEKRDRDTFVRQEMEERGETPLSRLSILCDAELWDEAQEQYDRVWSDPELCGPELPRYLARIWAGEGRYAEVAELGERPNVSRAIILVPLIRSYIQLDQLSLARVVAEEALLGKKLGAAFALGLVFEAENRLEDALHWYEVETTRVSLHRAEAFRSVALALMALGDYCEARVSLRLAVATASYLRAEDAAAAEECLRRP